MDLLTWRWLFRLRGGAKGQLTIGGPARRRLWSQLQDGDGFALFDTGGRRHAINLTHLLYCQFLFDLFAVDVTARAIRASGIGADEDPDKAPDKTPDADPDEDPDASADEELVVEMADGTRHTLAVELDCVATDEAADDGEPSQLQHLFATAESGSAACFMITDVDGETAFIRAADVAMLSAPLWVVEPALWAAEVEAARHRDSEAAGTGHQARGGEDRRSEIREGPHAAQTG